jgi:hypothetical protein
MTTYTQIGYASPIVFTNVPAGNYTYTVEPISQAGIGSAVPGSGPATVSTATTSSYPNTPVTLAAMTRSSSNLQISGSTKRLSGLNAYWLGLDDNAGTSTGSYPSQGTITAAMSGMKNMGIDLVRAHTIGISQGMSSGNGLSYATYSSSTGAVTYNDAALAAADWAVYQASLQGIYLMIPLTDNWNYYHGGKWVFCHAAYLQNSSGLVDCPGTTKDDQNERQFFASGTAPLRIRAVFKDYISHLLNHVNQFTGVAYKNDPTIAIIETGNETYVTTQPNAAGYAPDSGYVQDICSYIKSIASAKLTADGAAADRAVVSVQQGLTAAACDIVGAHYYPQTQSGSYPPTSFEDSAAGYPAGNAIQQVAADSAAASGGNKAFIIGEYPWTRSDVSAFWTAVSSSISGGDMAWSFIGGTETHGGAFGTDDFPVHWPYASGSEATYAPALASHINSISGVALASGAGASAPTAPTAFTSDSPGNANVSSGYSYTFVANGTSPTYTVNSGSLPAGLSLSNGGVLSGTPTTTGTSTFTIKATNSSGNVISGSLSIVTSAAVAVVNLITPVTVQHAATITPFTTGACTIALDNTVYEEGTSSIKVTPSGSGVYPYFFPSVPTSGGFPVTAGSTYTGMFSVRPTTTNAGASWLFSVVFSFYDTNSNYITPASNNLYEGSAVSSGQGAWTQCLETVVAPTGAAYAIIQPQADNAMNAIDIFNIDEFGAFPGTVSVWSASDTGSVTAPTAFSADSPPTATVGTAYSYTFTANGTSPTYAVSSGSIPAGLTLSSSGVLSGTPTTAATSTFVVTATNSAGSTGSGSLSIVANAATPSNLVTNPSAATNVTGGTANNDVATTTPTQVTGLTPHANSTSTTAFGMTGTTSNAYSYLLDLITNYAAIVTGSSYTISAWVNLTTGSGSVGIKIANASNAGTISADNKYITYAAGSGWQQITYTTTATSNGTSGIGVFVDLPKNTTFTAQINDISVRQN